MRFKETTRCSDDSHIYLVRSGFVALADLALDSHQLALPCRLTGGVLIVALDSHQLAVPCGLTRGVLIELALKEVFALSPNDSGDYPPPSFPGYERLLKFLPASAVGRSWNYFDGLGFTGSFTGGTNGFGGYFGFGFGFGGTNGEKPVWQNSISVGDPTAYGLRTNVTVSAFRQAGFSSFVNTSGSNLGSVALDSHQLAVPCRLTRGVLIELAGLDDEEITARSIRCARLAKERGNQRE